MQTKTIVVFANSVKHGQHCVAGKCIATGLWVRPVADARGSALSAKQVMYQNNYGTYSVKPMQKIEMYLDSHVPLNNQPENYMLTDKLWQQRFKIDERQLPEFLDFPDDLWGRGDRVRYQDIQFENYVIAQSLYLIQPDDFSINFLSGKPRAQFIFCNNNYNLAITDPLIRAKLTTGLSDTPIICVSLGEVYQGNCYKLVANIF